MRHSTIGTPRSTPGYVPPATAPATPAASCSTTSARPARGGLRHGLGFAAPPGVEDWFGYVGSLTKYWGATFSDNGAAVTAGTGPDRLLDQGDQPRRARLRPRREVRPPSLLPHGRPPRAPLLELPRIGHLRPGPAPAGGRQAPTPRSATRSSPSPPRSTSSRSTTSPTGSPPARTSATPAARTSSSACAARPPPCRPSTVASASSSDQLERPASSTTPCSSSPPTTATSSASTAST